MDNIININTSTREMYADYDLIGVNGENNFEYLVFVLDEQTEGNPRLEVIQGTNKYLIDTANFEIEDNQYKLPVKNSMLTENAIIMQFCLYNANNELTFKSLKYQMNIAEAINATETIPDEYETWYENASQKLAQMDNIDIDANKEGNVATVEITNKEGITKTVQIRDGDPGPKGDVNFATFDIEDGDLIMNKDDDMNIGFEINNNGELEVEING